MYSKSGPFGNYNFSQISVKLKKQKNPKKPQKTTDIFIWEDAYEKSSAKLWSFCSGLNIVLTAISLYTLENVIILICSAL